MPLKAHSNLIDTRRIAAENGRSQNTFMKHTQPLQSMNTNTSKNGLPIFSLGGFLDDPSTGSTLPKKEDSESSLDCLDTMQVVPKINETFLPEFFPTTDDLHKS